jgi:hypothetical protein
VIAVNLKGKKKKRKRGFNSVEIQDETAAGNKQKSNLLELTGKKM